jgi:hypothetical protein
MRAPVTVVAGRDVSIDLACGEASPLGPEIDLDEGVEKHAA